MSASRCLIWELGFYCYKRHKWIHTHCCLLELIYTRTVESRTLMQNTSDTITHDMWASMLSHPPPHTHTRSPPTPILHTALLLSHQSFFIPVQNPLFPFWINCTTIDTKRWTEEVRLLMTITKNSNFLHRTKRWTCIQVKVERCKSFQDTSYPKLTTPPIHSTTLIH